jgi:DNA invertase Pin-like site-specific DNA recombinase
MKIDYVRSSKQERHEALQIDALKKAGCEKSHILIVTFCEMFDFSSVDVI